MENYQTHGDRLQAAKEHVIEMFKGKAVIDIDVFASMDLSLYLAAIDEVSFDLYGSPSIQEFNLWTERYISHRQLQDWFLKRAA